MQKLKTSSVVLVTLSALVQRMRRYCARHGQVFHTTRPALYSNLGFWYVTEDNVVQISWDSPEELAESARELGVLKPYENLAELLAWSACSSDDDDDDDEPCLHDSVTAYPPGTSTGLCDECFAHVDATSYKSGSSYSPTSLRSSMPSQK